MLQETNQKRRSRIRNSRYIANDDAFAFAPMKYRCTITRQADGRWSAEHTGSDIGSIRVVADSRETARRDLENELRYRVEMCPCTGRAFRNLEIEFVDAGA
jgi:hypothetical protein